MRLIARCLIGFLVLALLLASPLWAATTVTVGTDPTKSLSEGA